MNHFECLCDVATKEVGVHESGGNNHGPRVEEYQKSVAGFKAEGQSWCMAFVQWCVSNVECLMNANTVLYKHEHCLTVWNNTPKEARVEAKDVFPGCVVIWQHGDTSNGHTGIVTSVTDKNIGTVEGNTSDGEGINRDGDGVFSRVRTKTGTGSMKVLGFLNPFYPEVPSK